MDKKKILDLLDFTDFNPTLLERAVAGRLAKKALPMIDLNNPNSLYIIIVSIFLAGITFGRRNFTKEQLEGLEDLFSEDIEIIKRIDAESDRAASQTEGMAKA